MDQRTAVILFTIMNLAVIAVLLLALQALTYFAGNDTVIMVVLSKHPLDGDSRMLIKGYYADGRTDIFEFKDVYGKLHFGASTAYAYVEPGHQYQFTVSGLEIPQIGWYRTVMEINRKLV